MRSRSGVCETRLQRLYLVVTCLFSLNLRCASPSLVVSCSKSSSSSALCCPSPQSSPQQFSLSCVSTKNTFPMCPCSHPFFSLPLSFLATCTLAIAKSTS